MIVVYVVCVQYYIKIMAAVGSGRLPSNKKSIQYLVILHKHDYQTPY